MSDEEKLTIAGASLGKIRTAAGLTGADDKVWSVSDSEAALHTKLHKLGWCGTWGSRVDSEIAISSLSDFWCLELSPHDDNNQTCVTLVAWPDPSEIHVELYGLEGSHVELSQLNKILKIGNQIFSARFKDPK